MPFSQKKTKLNLFDFIVLIYQFLIQEAKLTRILRKSLERHGKITEPPCNEEEKR